MAGCDCGYANTKGVEITGEVLGDSAHAIMEAFSTDFQYTGRVISALGGTPSNAGIVAVTYFGFEEPGSQYNKIITPGTGDIVTPYLDITSEGLASSGGGCRALAVLNEGNTRVETSHKAVIDELVRQANELDPSQKYLITPSAFAEGCGFKGDRRMEISAEQLEDLL